MIIMKKGTLRNSYIIESGKKKRNKKNEKTTSTEVDSNSQKGNSSNFLFRLLIYFDKLHLN